MEDLKRELARTAATTQGLGTAGNKKKKKKKKNQRKKKIKVCLIFIFRLR
jgi:hypothetical protein